MGSACEACIQLHLSARQAVLPPLTNLLKHALPSPPLTTPQELEKFKFVLDYKIKELKKQIEPREAEIVEMKEQIKEVGGVGCEGQ